MYITLLFLNQYIARIVIIKPPSLKAMRILTITIVVNVAYLFCLLVYLFLPHSTILQWNFGTVRIVWYFLFQILWKSLWYVYEDLEKTCVAMGIYIYVLVLAGITLEWFFFFNYDFRPMKIIADCLYDWFTFRVIIVCWIFLIL